MKGVKLEVRLVPHLQHLALRTNTRLFKDLTVPEIVQRMLDPWPVAHRLQLSRRYATRTMCNQYRETDLAFVRRIAAEEGLFFFFDHLSDPTREVVVFADSEQFYPPIHPNAGSTGLPAIPYGRRHRDGRARPNSIDRFELAYSSVQEGAVLADYDFRRPAMKLLARAGDGLVPTTATRAVSAHQAKAVLFEHHDRAEHEAGAVTSEIDDARAQITLERLRARREVAHATSNVRASAPGHAFKLENHPLDALNSEFVIVAVRHSAEHREESQDQPVYRAELECVPAATCYRPAHVLRPLAQTLETATVVGPPGEEIWVDELGRIKVHFHWDVDGARDESASCWLRHSQTWAGSGWGMQMVPRVGMEVLVAFVGGDPDRPVVTGCVRNAVTVPNYPLPLHKSQTGWRTQSTPGGIGFNELTFEDLAHHERIYVHAQRDHDVHVRHNETVFVGHDQATQVLAEHSLSVGASTNQTVAVDADVRIGGDRTLSVGRHASAHTGGMLNVEVGQDAHLAVGDHATLSADYLHVNTAEGVDVETAGAFSLQVGTADAPRGFLVRADGAIQLMAAEAAEIDSEQEIVLRCGTSSIRLGPERIEILADEIVVHGSGVGAELGSDSLTIQAKDKIHGRADRIAFEASGASVGLTSEAKIDGAKVLLNSPSTASDVAEPEPGEPTVVKLVDAQGDPIPYERVTIRYGDGSERTLVLNAEGQAQLTLTEDAEIVFPHRSEVSKT